MNNRPPSANMLHHIFALGIWVKGLDGLLEIAGGLLLLLASNRTVNQIVVSLTQHELVEDPHDWIATTARNTVAHISANTQLFASIYLIAHGLIKIVLVSALLRGERWAYPAAIGFLSLFIAYQIYRLSYQFTPGLALLTLFDLLIVGLTWREYRITLRQ